MLLYVVSNKGWLEKLICSYLTELSQSIDAEIVYSVGSHCTNLIVNPATNAEVQL